jgi:WD40 repeat protein
MQVSKIHELTGHRDCIYAACLNASRTRLYTSGGDGIIAEWDFEKGGDGEMAVKVDAGVYSLAAISPEILLVGSSRGNLYIIDPLNKKELRNIEAHKGGIFTIVHHKPAGLIFTGGFDGLLNIWDEDLRLRHQLKLSDKSIRAMEIIPSGIAVSSSDSRIYIIDTKDLSTENILSSHTNSVFALAYNPHQDELLSGGRDCYLKIWDMRSMELKKEYIGATLHINHICFNPSFTFYAVSSMDKTIKIFDASTHEPCKFIDKQKNGGHTSSVNKCIWLSDGRLISVSDDKTAMLWHLEN